MIEAENSTIYLATRHSFLLLTVLYYPMLGEGRSQEILSRKDAKRGMMNSLCASAPLRDISNKAFLNNNFILDFLANNQSLLLVSIRISRQTVQTTTLQEKTALTCPTTLEPFFVTFFVFLAEVAAVSVVRLLIVLV